MTDNVCRMDAWCSTRDQHGVPGADDGRGFCWPDERHGEHVIRQLLTDYVTLVSMTPKDASGSGSAGVSTIRAEAPIPLRLDFESLVRQIAWTVDGAESAVREISRLADIPVGGVRPGRALERGVAVLGAHYSALLALRSVAYLPYVTDYADERLSGSLRPQPVDVDGPWFVAELVRLHHRARAMVGLTRRRESRALPCPLRSAGGCSLPGREMYTLSTEVGSDVVECDSCGWSCSGRDYAEYAMTLRVAA